MVNVQSMNVLAELPLELSKDYLLLPSTQSASYWDVLTCTAWKTARNPSISAGEKKELNSHNTFGLLQNFSLTLSPYYWEPWCIVVSSPLWGTTMSFSPFKMLFLWHRNYPQRCSLIYLGNPEEHVVEQLIKLTFLRFHSDPCFIWNKR